jgi:magnesium-transporting ATPase (P-type)
LIEVAYRMGYDYEKFRNRDRIKKIFPFSSEKKKMATIYEDEKGKLYAFVKGAPDFMKPVCTHYVDKESKVSKINEDFTNQYEAAIQ